MQYKERRTSEDCGHYSSGVETTAHHRNIKSSKDHAVQEHCPPCVKEATATTTTTTSTLGGDVPGLWKQDTPGQRKVSQTVSIL